MLSGLFAHVGLAARFLALCRLVFESLPLGGPHKPSVFFRLVTIQGDPMIQLKIAQVTKKANIASV
jgi:hypothetical protein